MLNIKKRSQTTKDILRLAAIVVCLMLVIAIGIASLILLGTYGKHWSGPAYLFTGLLLILIIGIFVLWIGGDNVE